MSIAAESALSSASSATQLPSRAASRQCTEEEPACATASEGLPLPASAAGFVIYVTAIPQL
eukprot:2131642-Alexandrium_andersonii.AAC.1